MATTSVDRWISVDRELPPADTVVLVHEPEAVEPVWFGLHDGGRWLSFEGRRMGEVRHWQPLPSAPEDR